MTPNEGEMLENAGWRDAGEMLATPDIAPLTSIGRRTPLASTPRSNVPSPDPSSHQKPFSVKDHLISINATLRKCFEMLFKKVMSYSIFVEVRYTGSRPVCL